MPSPFIESIRSNMRLRGYSLRTEKAYLYWIRRFIHFNNMCHPKQMSAPEVKAFLTGLAVEQHVAVNTQKVALNAVVFLYHKVLDQDLGELGFTLASKQRSLPVVLNRDEVARIVDQLEGRNRLIITLLYGSGLRVSECLRLRVQDVDLERYALTVRDGKGRKDRQTLLSPSLVPALHSTIDSALALQQADNQHGVGPSLPDALGRKYPNAYCRGNWAFIFPSTTWCQHPLSGVTCRHHLHQSVIRKALAQAVSKAELFNKKGQLPHLSPFLCHASITKRHRYSHRAGITRAQRCEDHPDLHPCVGPVLCGHTKPSRPAIPLSPSIPKPHLHSKNYKAAPHIARVFSANSIK